MFINTALLTFTYVCLQSLRAVAAYLRLLTKSRALSEPRFSLRGLGERPSQPQSPDKVPLSQRLDVGYVRYNRYYLLVLLTYVCLQTAAGRACVFINTVFIKQLAYVYLQTKSL